MAVKDCPQTVLAGLWLTPPGHTCLTELGRVRVSSLPSSGEWCLNPAIFPAWRMERTLTGGPEILAPGGPTSPVAPFVPGGPWRRQGTRVTGAGFEAGTAQQV